MLGNDGLKSLLDKLDIKIAAFLFSGNRADYYLYLAEMIEGTQGKMTLRDIFASDAVRYGDSVRGKLSRHWLSRFENGGMLSYTFRDTFPADEVAFIHSLQASGGENALEEGLKDLSRNTQLISKAKSMVWVTMAAAIFCLLMLVGLVFGMPSYTVPKLSEAFSILPPNAYPQTAKDLFAFADFISSYWHICLLAIITTITAVIWTLSNVYGKPRDFLNKYLILWAIHRDFQSIKFLSTLSAALRKSGNNTDSLKSAVESQISGASRWKQHYIYQMLNKVDRGVVDASIFETGLIEKKMQWFIADLIESRGLQDALNYVRVRLEETSMRKLSAQAVTFSWVLLLLSIGLAGYLLFWHIEAIESMKTAMQNYLS